MRSVLLIGLGRFGLHVAKELNSMGHEVMALDTDEERVNTALPYVTSAQIGDSTSREVLEDLGVKSFDACIVTIGDNFESSLVTTDLLKELGAKRIIARASRGVQEKILRRCGADEVVYPEKQLAAWTAIRCTAEHVLDYIELDDDYTIMETQVPPTWQGKTVLQLDLRRRHNINVLGLRENGRLNLVIAPDTVLRAEFPVLIMGRKKDLQKLLRL